jgi:hypothetical protein
VITAAFTLSQLDKEKLYAKEIAAEANRILEGRGEFLKLSPEKVGRILKRVGLLTRRLDKDGNGLPMDRATKDRVKQVAASYVDEPTEEEAKGED